MYSAMAETMTVHQGSLIRLALLDITDIECGIKLELKMSQLGCYKRP